MTQDVKNDIKKAIQVNTIPLVAIMTAVTTVLTMFVKIPTPTRGYLNLSDTMIFFSSRFWPMRGKPETEVRADMNPPSDMNNAPRSSYHKTASYKASRKFECRYKLSL